MTRPCTTSARAHAECRHVVLGLIFLKCDSDTFANHRAKVPESLHAKTTQSHTRATLRDTLLPKLLSGELSAEAASQT